MIEPPPPLTQKIEDADFPCVMAKNVFGQGHAHRIPYPNMADLSEANIAQALQQIYSALDGIASAAGYHSILLEFDTPQIQCEHQFEALMWRFLQALHDQDSRNHAWDARVSSDPHSSKFSYSLGGEAFYIIGLHPKSSRLARQVEKPTLVFNLHSQFEKIRGMGTYTALRDKIRARDLRYSGSVNPMLADFGSTTEAMQYSGRHFDKDHWECPFKAKPPQS
jgi:hypothetical protein